MSVSNIDEDMLPVVSELEAFRVLLQWNVHHLGSCTGIDHRQRSASIADVDSIRGIVNAYIVCILTECNFSRRREIGASE